MSQPLDSYSLRMAAAQAGQKYDLRPDTVMSYAADAAIPFGKAVAIGDADNKCKEVSLVGDTFLGVALFSQTQENPKDNGNTGASAEYEATDTVNVLREGACWVTVTSDVAAEAAAYVDVVSSEKGDFTDVSASNLAVPGGKFLTTATAGNLAVLQLKN